VVEPLQLTPVGGVPAALGSTSPEGGRTMGETLLGVGLAVVLGIVVPWVSARLTAPVTDPSR
jgi:hypothetical protein